MPANNRTRRILFTLGLYHTSFHSRGTGWGYGEVVLPNLEVVGVVMVEFALE